MRRILALLLTLSLFACSDDPTEVPDAGTSETVDAGTEEQTDAGKPPTDGGGTLTVGFAQLEGPKQRKVITGGSTEIGVLVYVGGVTEGDGAGAGIEVDVGYGAVGALPSTFTFSKAQYAGDADGLGPKANDRYTLSLSPPAGVWDVAARVRCDTCDVKELLVDLNWSQPDYDAFDAITVTVNEGSIGWCGLAPPFDIRGSTQGEETTFAIRGQVFAEGLTEAAGAATQILGEAGIGPVNTDPRTDAGWTWSPSSFESQLGNNDLHSGEIKLSGLGSRSFAYRFTLNGTTVYCDTDGNDGTAGGFDPTKLGLIEAIEKAIDFGQLEGNASVTIAGALTVTGVVHSAGTTEGSGQGAGLTVVFGYGEPESDPATHASWKWTAATYQEDADGLTPGDKANDRYTAALQVPEGTWDVAMGARVGTGSLVLIDRDGTTNGYQPAQAMKVTVIQPKVDWCKLLGPASASGQLGRMQPVNVTAQVWSQGLTDVTSGVAPAGLEAELGIGAAGSDPASPTGWTWTSGAFKNDQGNDDVFEGSLNPAAIGDYAFAFRFRIGTGNWHLCDLDGNDGMTGGFDPTGIGALSVTPPRVDFAKLEGAQDRKSQGGPVEFTALLYADGITVGSGLGAGLVVEIGYGEPGSDPATHGSWTWRAADYETDVDGLSAGDLANDRYKASLDLPENTYDVAMRATLLGGPPVFIDLDGTGNGYQAEQAIQLEIYTPKVNWCVLNPPLTGSLQVGRGSFEVNGEVYGLGLTDQPGQQTVISAEVGYGPASSDPRSATGWSWSPATFDGKGGIGNSNDRYKASLAPQAAGAYAFTYRFRLGTGDWFYCDSDGNDGSPNAFEPANLGTLQVLPSTIDFAQLEGAADRTVSGGTSVTVTGVFYIVGVTDQAGPGADVTVQLGHGPRGSDPGSNGSWIWDTAMYKEDADGLVAGDKANDRYEASVTLPDGEYDLAMRVRWNNGPYVFVDLDGTSNGYVPQQAIKLTVSSPKIGYCQVLAPTTGAYQHNRGSFTSNSEVYAAGLTNATGQGAGVNGELGYGARGTDPRTASWTWTAGAFDVDAGNNDMFKGTITPPAGAQYSFGWRFRLGTGAWFYCDTDGNDGTSGGFDPAKLGALDVLSPWVDYAVLEGTQVRTLNSGGTATVSLMVYADGITVGAGQGGNVTVEVGYGSRDTAPSSDPSWHWSTATYKADVDGLFPNDKANDRYEGELTPPDGAYDVAARVKLWSGEWVYVDLGGTDDGYDSANAIKLGVNPPQAIAWAQLRAISPVENVGAKFFVSGEAYAPGVTDAVGQGAGITAEVGIGPFGTDPRTSAEWSWTAASYFSDAPGGGTSSNDVYGVWVTTPPAGQYTIAMRFRMGATTTWVDRDGGTAFALSELAPLDAFAPGTDIPYCNVQLAASTTGITVNAGADFQLYGQLWVPGVTDNNGNASGTITSQIAWGPDASDPRTAEGWFWSSSGPNPGWDFGQNNDEHTGTLTAPSVAGSYRFLFRFRMSAGWTYCDADSGNGTFDVLKMPTLTVP